MVPRYSTMDDQNGCMAHNLSIVLEARGIYTQTTRAEKAQF